ncbi:hypothetical protein A1Q2_02881 [Trichosporon asahii var. asahii CBS 8904]|uniref:NADH dehydrogenase [ubiquinone] 1 beta subcomplex subunit 7 n=1 Tax=Trichosporon asahii var. asahii (strain CBS 8904) TaxID=1220162 RepID=K1VQB5_TRIAC|nr:hypothetical protein A1Q2_02881 [Trichosporon asahii var. asahii CBS 8904]
MSQFSALPSPMNQADPSLLIPLNICRHKENYLTWKCDDERHAYDKCQYDEYDIRPLRRSLWTEPELTSSYMRRMKQLSKEKREAREAASDE